MGKSNLSIILFLSMLVGLVSIDPIHSKAQSPVTELLVEFTEDTRMMLNEETASQVKQRKNISSQVELWSLTEDADAEMLQQQLRDDPNVLYVEPNVEREIAVEHTYDPYRSEQWWISRVRPEVIWTRVSEQKKSVSVAVIDSGVDAQHEDLEKRITQGGYNFYNDNRNFFDETGHGTMVSGVIAAEYGNGVGVTGIAGPYDVKVLALKVFGNSPKTKTSYIVAAIDYAVAQKVDVINLSLGGPVKSNIEDQAIQRAIQAGITVVAAAGNKAEEDNRPFYPASYANVISVGSVDEKNQHVKSSNYNDSLSLVAPGTFIYTTTPDSEYGSSNGTSFSAPIVAGAVAILKSLQPEKTPYEIKKILQGTATGLIESGTTAYFGSGLLNLAALDQTLPVRKVPVQRVELSAEAVTMDLSGGIHSTGGVAVAYPDLKSMLSIANEQEPNDTFAQANGFWENSKVRGTITETYKDIDFYQMEWKSSGKLKLEGNWTKDDFAGGYNNQFLRIDLYDEKQNWIGKADYEMISNGQKGLSMEVELPAGRYYIAVSQTAANDDFFINHEYELSNTFTPGNVAGQIPNFFLDDALMKVGDKEFFLNKDDKFLEWSSSDLDVAIVDKEGMVTAKSPGSAIIEFYIGNSKKTLRVTVLDATTESKFALYAKVYPADATDQSVFWTTSDPSIAEVDQQGVVTAKKVGTAFVTARAKSGAEAAIATINVIQNGKGMEFEGDFPSKEVTWDKVFEVTFTSPLSPLKDYSQDIIIARNANGSKRVYNFTARVNPLNYKQLLISPGQYWDPGYHYLTVTKNVQNVNFTSLTKESRIVFYSYNK